MTLNQLIQQIVIFAEKETQKIIAELQRKRFENDGDFNGHEPWKRNDPRVIDDKGFDKPLYDSGELASELEDPSNWDLQPRISGGKLTLTIPDRENFTDPKYDVLDTGGKVSPYIGRSGKTINIHSVPPRPFRDLSSQDIDWITEQLILAIRRKFG